MGTYDLKSGPSFITRNVDYVSDTSSIDYGARSHTIPRAVVPENLLTITKYKTLKQYERAFEIVEILIGIGIMDDVAPNLQKELEHFLKEYTAEVEICEENLGISEKRDENND